MATNKPNIASPSKSQEFSGIFTGVVVSSDPTTYNIVVSPLTTASNAIQKMQAVPLSHCFASLFGFKDAHLPQPGSSVLCFKVQPTLCYILGIISNGDSGYTEYPQRTIIGAGDSIVDQGNIQGYGTDFAKILFNNMRRATDVVDGEHVIANDFGVMLGLFQQLAVLKASEQAQVQCFLMDDLVRIISHNFEHYTALGEFRVYHDGKAILAEFAGTHLGPETYGMAQRTANTDDSPFEETDEASADDVQDFYSITTNERVQAIERFKIYLGRLGDLINAFVAIPAEGVVKDLDGTVPSKPDIGAANLHVGVDGAIHVRTIKEAFIEKVNWIRIPQRIRSPEDPTGDDASNVDFPVSKEFEFNNAYTLEGNPFLYYLQLRDYASYVHEVINYENIKTLPKDFYVNDDINNETPIGSVGMADPNTPEENLSQYTLRTSGFYLQPNGGFMLKDAWGSSIVSEGGNIYIQPAKDLVLQPMRNLVGKIGQFTSIASKKDIDFSSTDKGIRFKSNTSQYFYSDNSGMVFQANGSTPSPGTPNPNTGVTESVGGLVFKSKLGIYNYAESDILNYAKQNLLLKSDNALSIQSKTQLNISSNSFINIGAGTSLGLFSLGSATLAASQACLVGGGGTTAIGQKDSYLGVKYLENSPIVDPIRGVLDIGSLLTQVNSLVDTDILKQSDSFQSAEQFDNLEFKFLATSTYGGLTNSSDPIPQTIAQQQEVFLNTGTLSDWKETAVNGTYPYPGADLFTSIYAASTGFNNLQKYGSQDLTDRSDAVNRPAPISNISMNTYKILEPGS